MSSRYGVEIEEIAAANFIRVPNLFGIRHPLSQSMK